MPDTQGAGAESPLSRLSFSPAALGMMRTAVSLAEIRGGDVYTETLYFAFMGFAQEAKEVKASDVAGSGQQPGREGRQRPAVGRGCRASGIAEAREAGGLDGPPLSGWNLPKMRFRRAGRDADPLSPDLARALWLLILKTNPELRSRLEDWVSEDSLPEPMPTDVPWMEDVRLVGFLRRMVLEDGNARLSAGSGKGFW